MMSSPETPNPNGERKLPPHSGGVDEGWDWDMAPPMNHPDQEGPSSSGGDSMSSFTTEGEVFEATPKIKIVYGDNSMEVDAPLHLDKLLSIARSWGIRRFVTDPPLTRDDFPINESMALTLIPRDKEA